MKTDIVDPWCCTTAAVPETERDNSFEDSFVVTQNDHKKLSDSEQYLQRLYSRLRDLQTGTSKQDLVTSLSAAKEDCIARLITSGHNFQSEEEVELARNPLIRHIAPHLQALTASELVHLLKADTLQLNSEAELEVST